MERLRAGSVNAYRPGSGGIVDEMKSDGKGRVVMLVTNPVRSNRPDPRVYREALALQDYGYHVTILAWDRQSEEDPIEILNGIRIERIQTSIGYGLGQTLVPHMFRYWKEVLKRLKRMPWDIIHCHDLDTLPPGFIAAKRRRRIVIFDAHESYPDYVAPRVSRAVVWLLGHLECFLVRRIHAVIAVGEAMAEKYRALGGKRVVVVGSWHNPEDMLLSDEQRSDIRGRLQIDGLMIAYAGSFGRNRALTELVEAVKKTAGTTLVLAGGGNQRAAIEERIAGCSRIKYLGVIPSQKALEIKAASDVVYRVTRAEHVPNARFSAPNNLFEAMAAGVAVIGARNGDLGRILVEEKCGVVLEDVSVSSVAQALEALKDETILTRMRENALRAARMTYNWTEASRRLVALYQVLQEGDS